MIGSKVNKLRREAQKQIARAYREFGLSLPLETAAPAIASTGEDHRSAVEHPAPPLPKALPDVTRAVQALHQTLAGPDLAKLEKDTKKLKNQIDQHVPFWRTSTVREYTEAIIVALFLALIIRTFIIQAFKIPSGSMIPTLRVGDHILVNKFIYGLPLPFMNKKIFRYYLPERGDIIVFKFPQDQTKDYIKRVIGIPGDTVKVSGNSIFINGVEIAKQEAGTYRYEDPRPFEQTSRLYQETLGRHTHDVLYDLNTIRLTDTEKVVPEGQYFCMGDNRDHSNDSRYWGFVPFELIKGKAMIIYFSWPPGQFRRIGKLVR